MASYYINLPLVADATDVSALVVLTGVPVDEPDLGTFTGVTIPDDSTIKAALQALETAVEASGSGANVTLSNLTSPTAINQNLIFADVPGPGPASILTADLSGTTQKLKLKTGESSAGSSGDIIISPGGAAVTSGKVTIDVRGLGAGTEGTIQLRDASEGASGKVWTSTDTEGTGAWATPSSGVTSVAMTVPSFLSVAGSPVTTTGTLAVSLSGTALPIANGGTGETSAANAINALLPTQATHSGQFLTTNGTVSSWAAAAPSGTVNTGAYFNASGVLASNADYKFITSTQSMGFAINAGTLNTTGNGSLAHGQTATSSVMTASNPGAHVHGFADGTASLTASGYGSTVHGYATGATSAITASSTGSLAHGYIDTAASRILSSAAGAHAFGVVSAGGLGITASGGGSVAGGYINANGGASATAINATNNGAFCHGYAEDSGTISATGSGSFAKGFVTASAAINAAGSGSFAMGYGGVLAGGAGSFAFGYAQNGQVYSSGNGATSIGDDILTSGQKASTFGLGQVNSSYLCHTLGRYATSTGTTGSWVSTDPLFVIGNGASSGARANALTILKDATMLLSGVAPVQTANASGLTADITLVTGTSSANASGVLNLYSGTANQISGNVNFGSGDGTGGTGDMNVTTGTTLAANVDSGRIAMNTGEATGTGDSGHIYISTGQVADGDGGNVVLYTPSVTGSGTRGKIQIQDGSEGTAGQILTSIDSNGSGTWSSLMASTPASASASGVAGQISYDASWFYVCVATNTWVRAAIATWV